MAEVFMINNLPEPLVLHTLSFLKTKEAVGTSLVSTTWRNLWTLVPSLDLNAKDFEDDKKFEDFVNSAMRFRKTKHLDTFRLTWEYCNDNKLRTIDKWICHVISFKPRVLEVNIGGMEEVQFPSCVFACATLESLRLTTNSNSLQEPINPEIINLPFLKSLNLGHLTVPNEFIKRLSTSSRLEELILDSCNLEISEISSVILKRLKIDHCEFSMGIRICAPSLVRFTCEGSLGLESFDNVPDFQEAYIESIFYCPEVTLVGGLNNATEFYFRGYCAQQILHKEYCQLFKNIRSLYFRGIKVHGECNQELIASLIDPRHQEAHTDELQGSIGADSSGEADAPFPVGSSGTDVSESTDPPSKRRKVDGWMLL